MLSIVCDLDESIMPNDINGLSVKLLIYVKMTLKSKSVLQTQVCDCYEDTYKLAKDYLIQKNSFIQNSIYIFVFWNRKDSAFNI